jgi:hypothetical protein
MTEANLLTLVTLQPENKALLSVTLQPLICADALFLDTDRPHCRPLEAVTAYAECFGEMPPDHVDIVSVVTCTPQNEFEYPGIGRFRKWHQQFRDSFIRAASDTDLSRHHFSTFVLSNFLEIQGSHGGLSGAFLPIPLSSDEFPPYVIISAWGRNSSESDNSWSEPVPNTTLGKKWSSLGYIASLSPLFKNSIGIARMFGFTINRLPRHTTHWGSNMNGLYDFQLRMAISDSDSGKVVFRGEV